MNALRQVSSPMFLLPAYGWYPTEQGMREAWEAGKDFRIGHGGPMCSVRDKAALLDECSSLWLVQPRPVVIRIEIR